tara:strand:- start:551 stop:1099 length:549 start_codon:yes stop_codon:yes gene_type:complete
MRDEVCDGIYVHDNEFPWNYMQHVFSFAKGSSYRFVEIEQDVKEACMISMYSDDDLDRLGFLDQIKSPEMLDRIAGRKPCVTFVNFDNIGEVHAAHTHYNQEVLLYQANVEWRTEWYGETIWWDTDRKDIIYCNQYTPGRIIWFDGNLPHSARPPSYTSPFCRFTLSLVFDKPGFTSTPNGV